MVLTPAMPTSPSKVRAFLGNLPLFSQVPEPVIDRIAAGTTELHAGRGEILFTRGDPCRGFYLLIYGQVKLSFVAAKSRSP